MNYLHSIILGISNFFLCYWTCWLFFSKRLNNLEERYLESYKEHLSLCKKINNLNTDVMRIRQNLNDNQIIKGVFKNTRDPKQSCEFLFKLNKDHEIERYHLEDGKTYELPYYVVRQLRKDFEFNEVEK